MRDGDGNRRLAHPAGPDHADEAVRPQQHRYFGDSLGAPHHSRRPWRQPVRGGPPINGTHRRQRGWRCSDPPDGRHEAIAAAGHVGDVPRTVLAVAKRFAKTRNVHTQI